jgi:N-acetylglucosaminyldiphosphoundecaprenol N-acetyl-beta-D-mannosaminyltransferase
MSENCREGLLLNRKNPHRTKDERIDVLGVGISPINLTDAVAAIERWIADRSCNYVCVTGVHGVMESRHDERLRGIHNAAGMVTPDGMPLVWLLRLLGWRHTERVCGCDLMKSMTSISELRGYRQFYYGGPDGLAETLKQVMVAAHPLLEVVGTHCPPFRELTPAVGVGAAFDFLAGTRRRAPRWMQRSGLEWLHRVCSEPRRLWHRYASIVPGFMIFAAGALVGRAIRRRWSAPL